MSSANDPCKANTFNREVKSASIRMPSAMHLQVNQLARHRRELEATLGRPPTDEELAEKMELTPEQVRRVDIGAATTTTTSFDTFLRSRKSIGGGSRDSFQCLLADDRAMPFSELSTSMMQEDLQELLAAVLTERESFVLRRRYGLDGSSPQTLEQIGRSLQVTRERVRQIEVKAVQKLRGPVCALRAAREHVISTSTFNPSVACSLPTSLALALH